MLSMRFAVMLELPSPFRVRLTLEGSGVRGVCSPLGVGCSASGVGSGKDMFLAILHGYLGPTEQSLQHAGEHFEALQDLKQNDYGYLCLSYTCVYIQLLK